MEVVRKHLKQTVITASIKRRCASGRRAARSWTDGRDQRNRDRRCCRSRKRRASFASAGIRFCRSMTACTLQTTIPHLTRSSFHRCLQRHGIGRLAQIESDKPSKKKFKSYPTGFFHIDIAEVQTAEGKLYLFVAIDRTSKFAFVQLAEKANRVTASAFLVALVKAVPYKIHTVLTDNGIQFRLPPRHANAPNAP